MPKKFVPCEKKREKNSCDQKAFIIKIFGHCEFTIWRLSLIVLIPTFGFFALHQD